VPVVEAAQIAENLKQRGVPVEYILLPDEGHGSSARFRMRAALPFGIIRTGDVGKSAPSKGAATGSDKGTVVTRSAGTR